MLARSSSPNSHITKPENPCGLHSYEPVALRNWNCSDWGRDNCRKKRRRTGRIIDFAGKSRIPEMSFSCIAVKARSSRKSYTSNVWVEWRGETDALAWSGINTTTEFPRVGLTMGSVEVSPGKGDVADIMSMILFAARR